MSFDYRKSWKNGEKAWSEIWGDWMCWDKRKQFLLKWHQQFTPWVPTKVLEELVHSYALYKDYPKNMKQLQKKKKLTNKLTEFELLMREALK